MARSTTSVSSAVNTGSSRNRGMLMLAAVFGILSAVLMFAFLRNRGGNDDALQSALTSGATESVLVVTRDIATGERITADMVTSRPVPAAALLSGRIANLEDVEGKVATAPIFVGEQVVAAKVTTYVGQNTLAYKVPAGLRAVSLQIPHEAWALGGLVQPGDRVDILGITYSAKTDPLTGEEKPNVVSGLIAQDIEVLAVSQSLVKVIPNVDERSRQTADPNAAPQSANGALAGAPPAAEAKPDDKSATYEKAISVTLAMTAEQAAKVALIDAMKDEAGQYRLLARQKGDTGKLGGTTTWSLEEVLAPPKK